MVKHPETGKWVTGPAMDLQIVWKLFNSCIEASKVLDTDHKFRKTQTRRRTHRMEQSMDHKLLRQIA